MALVVKDRVKETTTTTGTGTVTLGGAVSGFQTFTSVLSNADTTYYAIIDYTNHAFEVGLGTFTSSGTTLARTTILESSNSGSAVDFGSGTKEVFITYPAEKSVYLDASNQLVINGSSVTSTVAELNIIDGGTSATSTTVADADRIVLNDNGTMVQVAVTDLSAYFDDEITAMPNLVTTAATTVGALNSGSITSGFGSIDTGSSAITTTGTITYGSLSDGTITVTAFVDEDNMSSNSATLIPTQQSVKAYVDSQVTAQDLDATTDSGTIDIDLDSETLTIAGGEGIDTSASGTTITITGEEATTSNKGVASFSSTFFSVSSGAVSLVAAQTGLTSVLNTSLVLGRDADNQIKFGTDNQIIFEVSGGDNVIFKASGEIEATSLDISGDADIDGTLEADAITVNGTALDEFISDTTGAMFSSNTETGVTVTYQDADNTIDVAVNAAQTTITSLLATDIKIGEDDQTKIDFETADEIHFYAANAEQVYVSDGVFGPQTDSDVDLGTTGVRWKDAYIDTVTSTTFTGALTGNASTATTLETARTIGGVSFNGSANIDLPGVNSAGNQNTSGTASLVTVANSTANTNFPVVFHDESNSLLDDTGALRYNPSTGELLVPKLTVAGTTTVVDTVTMNAANAIIFEGATADAHETTLSIVDPTADHTQYLINQGGYIPVLAAATTTAITSTPAELNILDGVTSTAAELNILDGVTSTTAEINLIDGGTSRGTTAVASGDGILINDAGTMRMTNVDTVSTYFASHNVGGGNIVTTGALNSGTITSGFGNIDTGSSTITTTGLISGGSLDIDNVLINGTTIGHTDDTDLITVANGLVTVAGEISVTTLDIGGTNVTSTAAELNILDGVTSTAAELNILDGVTSTAAELNILDGVTSTAAELNILDGVTSTASELNILDGVTSTAAELNIMDGNTSATSTTLADADRVVTNDNGTMVQVALTDIKTYLTSAGYASQDDATALAIALG